MDNPDILVEEESQEARMKRIIKAFVKMNEVIIWHTESIKNLIKLALLTDEQIASVMEVPVAYVTEIHES